MKSMTWEDFENFVKENESNGWTHFSGFRFNDGSYTARKLISMAHDYCDCPPYCCEEGNLGIPEIQWASGDVFVPTRDLEDLDSDPQTKEDEERIESIMRDLRRKNRDPEVLRAKCEEIIMNAAFEDPLEVEAAKRLLRKI